MTGKDILGVDMPSIDFAVDLLVSEYTEHSIIDKDIIEFGTFEGNTGKAINELLKYHDMRFNKFWTCDSFQGLPKEDKTVPLYENWQEGAFNAMADTGSTTVEETMSKIYPRIFCDFIPVELVPGFYSESLNDELSLKIKPVAFVHMDCDLYISAYQALDFLARNNLIVPGTIICYDDWGGNVEWEGGESLAHKQVSEKYGIKWQFLGKPLYNPPYVNTYFRCL